MPTDSVARIFSLAALEAGQLEKEITVETGVGGIPSGTVYKQGTPLATIITDLLGATEPPKDVIIYYGATDNIPTDISGLTSLEVNAGVLLNEEGYMQHITAGNPSTLKGQYPTIALPKKFIVTKWYVPGFEFDLPHSSIEFEDYNIYYLNDVSYDEDIGGIDYKFKIQEA